MTDAEENNVNQESQVRPEKVSRVVKYLVILNVVVFLAQYYLPQLYSLNLVEHFALYNYRSENFAVYQFITYMFLHAGIFHIFLNMFILWMFGSALEYIWHPKKFLFYFFFTGIGAGILHLGVSTYGIKDLENQVVEYVQNPGYDKFSNIIYEEVGVIPEDVEIPDEVIGQIRDLRTEWERDQDNPEYKAKSVELLKDFFVSYVNRPSIGASGAVFGVLLAFGMLFPNMLVYIYFLFPIKAKYFVVFLGLLELYFGVFGQESSIANFAHLGGMVFGFILIKIWGEKPRIQT